jgi:electron transfer flavoprotein beta subunit
MKILACISVVPDTTTKITFTDNNTQFNTAGVQYILNPYDELAVTRGLEIAEANGGTLTIVHVGKADAEPVIRKALSMGANEAIRIDAEAMDAQHVAEEISKIAGGYDLILTGRESIDYNGGAVCGLLGAMLGLPSVNVVTRIDYADGKFSFDRDIDGGRETVTVAGACVASAQKELQVLPSQTAAGYSQYATFELPAAKSGVKLIDPSEAGKLIDILRNEAKVI